MESPREQNGAEQMFPPPPENEDANGMEAISWEQLLWAERNATEISRSAETGNNERRGQGEQRGSDQIEAE